MTSNEISKIIIETVTAAIGTFQSHEPKMVADFWQNNRENPAAYRADFAPNWSYICCEDANYLLAFCLQHPEFSHFSHRNRYSVNIYWHCDDSPTRVRSVGTFDPSRMQEAYKLIGDEVGAGLAWAAGY
jgi:hypothetical protein